MWAEFKGKGGEGKSKMNKPANEKNVSKCWVLPALHSTWRGETGSVSSPAVTSQVKASSGFEGLIRRSWARGGASIIPHLGTKGHPEGSRSPWHHLPGRGDRNLDPRFPGKLLGFPTGLVPSP